MTLDELKAVYLIQGTEDLLLDQAVRRLRARFEAAGGSEFDIDVFDGESAEGDAVVSAANTFPFAAPRRLVVVRNADRLDKAGLDALADYASDPSESTVLVLVAPKVAKNTKLYKAVDRLKGVAEYKAPSKREYPSWVSAAFAERDRSIDREGSEALVSLVGFDLRRLEAEIEKVVAFAGDRRELTAADVRSVVASTATVSRYELLDAIGERDCGRALRLATRLLDDGESVFGLHALAVLRVRDLMAAASLAHRGSRGAAALASELRRPEWQVRRLPGQAERFAPGELPALLEQAASAEADMKTSRESRLVFERWIVSVCGE